MKKDLFLCEVCKKEFHVKDLTSADIVSQFISELIKRNVPSWGHSSFICYNDLNQFRSKYVREALKKDLGEISDLENDVLQSIREHEVIAENLNWEFHEKLTFGNKVADRVAAFGGSWTFIIFFVSIIIGWIVINSINFLGFGFDPFPFILLNLVLSCLAALQAPVIMMSQNRQQAKDRMRGELDYKVNLKAELEIRHLKAKIDQLSSHQWKRLVEIQELQTDLMRDLAASNNQKGINK